MQKLIDRDFIAALVLFTLGSIALAQEGADIMNWIFPHLATYLLLFVAAVLFARVFFASIVKRVPDIISVSADDRAAFVDVFLFLVIALGYLLVMYGLGFWLSSFLMLSLATIYLTQEKTLRNMVLAVVVPLATCIVAYFIFLHVFYVPVPEASWWSGLR